MEKGGREITTGRKGFQSKRNRNSRERCGTIWKPISMGQGGDSSKKGRVEGER